MASIACAFGVVSIAMAASPESTTIVS